MNRVNKLAGLALTTLVAGAAASCAGQPLGAPQPPVHSRLCLKSCADKLERAKKARRPPPHRGAIDLRQALRWAARYNPDLTVAARQRCVAAAESVATRPYPNPELHVDVEDWLGSGDVKGVRQLQLTIQVSQDIELGGKRSARKQRARIGRRAVGWEYALKRLDVLAQTSRAYVALLHAQRRFAVAQEQSRLSERLVAEVKKRLDAGKILPGEANLAGIRQQLATVNRERARRRLRRARLSLAATWGSPKPLFSRATGRLDRLPVLVPLKRLLARAARHPRLRRQQARIAARRAELAVERSQAYPDLSLRAGYRWLHGVRDSAVVVGVSIPLPFFDRNQGALTAARQRVKHARAARRALHHFARIAIRKRYERLQAGLFEAKVLTGKVLPTSRQSLRKLRESYQLGRASYLSVLEAQRTLFAVQERTLDVLLRLHTDAITLKKLSGDSLSIPAEHRPRGARKRSNP